MLYAMGFYSASVEDLKNQDIPQDDIDTIQKASQQLATVFRRLMVNDFGWKKVATGKFLSYGFCLSLLKSSSKMLGNAIRNRRQHAVMIPELESTNIDNMSRFPNSIKALDT